MDLLPDQHLPPLRTLDPSEMSKHPLFKQQRCKHQGKGCPRGAACPFAHSEDELRRPREDLPGERWLFEVQLRLSNGR